MRASRKSRFGRRSYEGCYEDCYEDGYDRHYRTTSRRRNELMLDSTHKKLGGVCGGIANYLEVPRLFVRIVAVVGLFIMPQVVLLAYGLAYLILDPSEDVHYDD